MDVLVPASESLRSGVHRQRQPSRSFIDVARASWRLKGKRNAPPWTRLNNERPHEGLNNQTPTSIPIPVPFACHDFMPEFNYPKGLLLRRVNHSADVGWHKNRVFISEVFRFEELGFELIRPGSYRVIFRNPEIGELNAEEVRFRSTRPVV